MIAGEHPRERMVNMLKQAVKMAFINKAAEEAFKAGIEFWAAEHQILRASERRTRILTKTVDGVKVFRLMNELNEEEFNMVINLEDTIKTLKEVQDKTEFTKKEKELGLTGKDLHIIKELARFAVPNVPCIFGKSEGSKEFIESLDKLEAATRRFNNLLRTCPTEKKGRGPETPVFDDVTKDAFVKMREAIVIFLNNNFGIREEGTLFMSKIFQPMEWHCSATLAWTVSGCYGTRFTVSKEDGKTKFTDETKRFRQNVRILAYAVVTGQPVETVRAEIEEEVKNEVKKGAKKA